MRDVLVNAIICILCIFNQSDPFPSRPPTGLRIFVSGNCAESSKVKDIKPRSAAASGIESKIEVKPNRD